MKIGFTGATGCVDFGDYAMLANNIHHIREHSPASQFCVFSYNLENTRRTLAENSIVEGCDVLEDVLLVMGRGYGNMPNSELNPEAVEELTLKWKKLFLGCVGGDVPNQLMELRANLSKCDVLLFNGGGYLNSNWLFRVYGFLTMIVLADQVQTPVIMLPQTYGPFSGDTLSDVGLAFQKVSRFYCRDRIYSEKTLRTLGVDGDRIKFAIDDLFLLAPPLSQTDYVVPSDALVVQLHKQMRTQITTLIEDVADLVIELVDEGAIQNVVFAIFHHDSNNELKIANEISGLLPDSIRTHIWGPDWNAGNLIGGFATAKAVLCSRYHPLVLALRQNTPAVNLLAADNNGNYDYYGAKNKGICEYTGVDDRSFCIESCQENVIQKAGEMLRLLMSQQYELSDSVLDVLKKERAALWAYILGER